MSKAKSIWLVWADRGSYSDRTEYAVCWYEKESAAKKRALHLQEQAAIWRRRVSDSKEPFGVMWDRARLALGDPQWSPSDDTDYSAWELERGATFVHIERDEAVSP